MWGLNKVTLAFIALGVIETIFQVWANATYVDSLRSTILYGGQSIFGILGLLGTQVLYSFHWFGTAALVEFLARILRELKIANAARRE